MASCKQEVDINAPVHLVWQLTQNMKRRSEWDFRIKEGQLLDASQPSIGVKLRTRGSLFGPFQFEMQYIAFVPNEKSAVKLVSCSGMPIERGGGSWHYEDIGNGRCRFKTNIQMTPKSTRLGKLIDRYCLQPFLTWMTRKSLQKLKQVAEEDVRAFV